jgi:hypothetical protein
MFYRIAMVVALTAATLFGTSNAQASIWVTDTAEFDAAGTSPPVDPISHSRLESVGNFQGGVFTNTLGDGGFTPGNEIRTVGAGLITSVAYGTPGQIRNTTLITKTIDGVVYEYVFLFGIQGEVLGTGSVTEFEAKFTEGRVQLALIPTGTFDPLDPLTWGFSADNPQYVLVDPPGNVVSGEFDLANGPWTRQIDALASTINISGVNVTTPTEAQGRFLFKEDPSHSVLDSDSGQLAPEGYQFTGTEGLYFESGQRLMPTVNPTTSANWAAQLDELNAIANWAFGDDFDTGVGTGVYSPTNPAQPGDFWAELSLSGTPVLQATLIPEPGALAIWGLLAGVAGIACARRRRLA